MIEHSKFSVPNRVEGYATDDNARALIALLKYSEVYSDPNVTDLLTTYLSFLLQMQKPDGAFYTGMDSTLHLHDDTLNDAHGRALWACGYAVQSKIEAGLRHVAKEVFDKGLKWSFVTSSPRIKAYAVKGLHYYQTAFPADPNAPTNLIALAEWLTDLYHSHSSPAWCWFEPYLTYANAILPHALFLAYESTGSPEFLHVAQATLGFLIRVQLIKGMFVPIGNKGWYPKGGKRSLYDQQPLEAATMIEAASSAFRLTGEKSYQNTANTVFDWFFGKNLTGAVLYDRTTGGCFDGINPEGLNLNQGAESTLSYLLARIEMEKMLASYTS